MTFKVKGGLKVNSVDVVNSFGSWTGNTIAILYGGTGATTAAQARTNLGLAIGTNVQAYDETLTSIATLGATGADKFIYFNSANTVTTSTVTSYARTLLAQTSASNARSTLGLGSISTQDSSNVYITGGAISGITDIAVADGGTGASSASDARTNLGVAIGTDVQAYHPILTSASGLSTAADRLPYFNGANTLTVTTFTGFGRNLVGASTASAARTVLALGTIATQSNTDVSITGGSITGIVDLAVADGGTGASTSAQARTNLGLAIGTDVQAYSPTLDSVSNLSSGTDQLPYFSSANTLAVTTFTTYGRSLVASSSATAARSTLGLGTIATQANNNVTITGGSITGITDLAIADGGTGASTAAGARTNLGLVIGTDVQAYDEQLSALATVSADADKLPYFTSSNTADVTTITSFGRDFLASANATVARSSFGLGTLSTQNSNSVTITGGSITGITNLAVADGGTGADTPFDARTNLGLTIGTDVQGYDGSLNAITLSANGYLVKTSATTVANRTFTAGTGVTVTNGNGVSGNTIISIGQNVSNTANVTFNDVTINGTLNSNDITSANIAINGNAIVSGNLYVTGTTTSVQTANVNIGNTILILNANEVSTPTQDSGIEVERGTAQNVKLLWKESTDRWTFSNDGTTYYNIPIPSEYNVNTYDISAVAVSSTSAKIRLTDSLGPTDDITFVGAGTVTVVQTDANTITITGAGSTESEVTGVTSASSVLIDSFSRLVYRSAEYTYTATVTSGTTHYVTGRILVLHNGSSAYNTQFAIISTNSSDDLVDFTTDVSGNNVRLLAQATAGNTVKIKITGATYSTV